MLGKIFKKTIINKYKPFKSSIEPAIWKRMSPSQRNAHKARQADFIKCKRKNKIKLILNKYPRGYGTTYRKTHRFKLKTSALDLSAKRAVVKKKLKWLLRHDKSIHSAYEVCAWKQVLDIQGFKAGRDIVAVNGIKSSRVFGVFKFSTRIHKSLYMQQADNVEINKFIYWDACLPIYYLHPLVGHNSVFETGQFVYVLNEFGCTQVNKNQYGSLIILNNKLDFSRKGYPREYEILKSNHNAVSDLDILKENSVIELYSQVQRRVFARSPFTASVKFKFFKAGAGTYTEKRSSIKHIVRMRYRWFFQPRLAQFKLFKKFFKRSFKRYRKINKNALFISKFRSHFPKLTGFTEKSLLRLWLPFRRNYNQYWSANNAVLRFSQTLLLTPANLLVFLQLSPSFAASKYIIKSGAIAINGQAVTALSQFKPGDIMQLNFVIWKAARHFFDYQKWNNDFRPLHYISFLQIDWSSLMFMMIRWPRKYELVAPSFLSERWVRYYIRQFPSKISNFRKADGNWKVYKRIVTKR